MGAAQHKPATAQTGQPSPKPAETATGVPVPGTLRGGGDQVPGPAPAPQLPALRQNALKSPALGVYSKNKTLVSAWMLSSLESPRRGGGGRRLSAHTHTQH